MTSDEYRRMLERADACFRVLDEQAAGAVAQMRRIMRELQDQVMISASRAADEAMYAERDAVVDFLRGAKLDQLADVVMRGEHLPKERPDDF